MFHQNPLRGETARRVLILFVVAAALVSSSADLTHATLLRTGQDWESDVQSMLNEFLACQEPIDDQSPCNFFLAKALKRVYGITDFDDGSGGVISANAIAAYVGLNSDKWTSLGDASSQDALTQAAGYANMKKAIIAVQSGAVHGHVALILPGNVTHSASWDLDVPNSASFFLNKPKQSYIGKPLSFAYQVPEDVKIYGRNF